MAQPKQYQENLNTSTHTKRYEKIYGSLMDQPDGSYTYL